MQTISPLPTLSGMSLSWRPQSSLATPRAGASAVLRSLGWICVAAIATPIIMVMMSVTEREPLAKVSISRPFQDTVAVSASASITCIRCET